MPQPVDVCSCRSDAGATVSHHGGWLYQRIRRSHELSVVSWGSVYDHPGSSEPVRRKGQARGRPAATSSRTKKWIVLRVRPVAAAAVVTPLQPSDKAYVAAHCRRQRSFIVGERHPHFRRIHSTTGASRIHIPPARRSSDDVNAQQLESRALVEFKSQSCEPKRCELKRQRMGEGQDGTGIRRVVRPVHVEL